MCSVVILRRPRASWPLLLAANRDEMRGRPSRPPGRHWPERPEVTAGLDLLSGGSWMGVNDQGLVACVLNRTGSLGPVPGKRSRGELVLEALDHAEARSAADALSAIDAQAYRTFNLLVADEDEAYWLAGRGVGRVQSVPVPPGVSMLTSHDMNDPASPRIGTFLPRFEAAALPDPDRGDWAAWAALLAVADPAEPQAGLNIATDWGFGTVSSSLLALPRRPQRLDEAPRRPVWLYAEGRPGDNPYRPLDL